MFSNLIKDDRILVLGATGWFGRTFMSMIPSHVDVMGVASSPQGDIKTWDESAIAKFSPTIVANFSFLTREKINIVGEASFRSVNKQLGEQFLIAANSPQVRAALTISSGAAVVDSASVYGEMKLHEEMSSLTLNSDSKSVVVGRAYSVSGPFVRNPFDYAFSDFILQAASGNISIKSRCLTYRRYVSVSDFLAVCMFRVLSGWSGVIESGGELLELGELAETIRDVVNPSAAIGRVTPILGSPSIYASDNSSWLQACNVTAFVPADLRSQIQLTAEEILNR